jgi:hypothetical protein
MPCVEPPTDPQQTTEITATGQQPIQPAEDINVASPVDSQDPSPQHEDGGDKSQSFHDQQTEQKYVFHGGSSNDDDDDGEGDNGRDKPPKGASSVNGHAYTLGAIPDAQSNNTASTATSPNAIALSTDQQSGSIVDPPASNTPGSGTTDESILDTEPRDY